MRLWEVEFPRHDPAGQRDSDSVPWPLLIKTSSMKILSSSRILIASKSNRQDWQDPSRADSSNLENGIFRLQSGGWRSPQVLHRVMIRKFCERNAEVKKQVI